MAKIVVMDKKVVKGVSICNFLAGGREVLEVPLWEDDVVKDFSYLDGRVIHTVSGRLSGVNLSFNTNKPKNKYTIKELASVSSLNIDLSSCYHSNVVNIPSESVLEYRPEEKKEEKKEDECICPYVKVDEEKTTCTCSAREEDGKTKCSCETCPKAPTCTCEYCVEGTPVEKSPSPEIDDAGVFPMMRLKLHLKLSDGTCTDADIEEGDQFTGMIHKSTPAPKIVYGHFKVLGFMYKGAGFNTDIVGLILDDGETVSQVLLSDIKTFGSEDVTLTEEELTGKDGKKLACTIKSYCEKDNVTSINLPVGTRCTEEIKFTKELAVRGINALTPANVGARANSNLDERVENVFEGKIDMATGDTNGGTSTSLIGLAFTKEANITYKAPAKLELINSKFVGLTTKDNKDIQITNCTQDSFDKVGLVTVDGCYFGPNNPATAEASSGSSSTGKVYNGLNFRFKVADGTRISNNVFTENSCSHNCINIYAMEDDAVINIENNHFYDADSAIRLAAQNSPKNVTININGSTYDGFSEGGKWGLVTIQPIAPTTEDLSGLTININNTKKLGDEKLFTYYVGNGETEQNYDRHKLPRIYVDGVQQEIVPVTSKEN